MRGVFEELAPTYQGRAIIATLNVDDNPVTAQRCGAESIPLLAMFIGGKIMDRMTGDASKNVVMSFIDRNL